ncbi:hydroxymethylglutaryl-CoA synthase [Candidatus Micrarchaeota archaeon]|nr:hydroxymethylglutaryl-CoA synthase [Candidatus Micrarchaeota archaeon]
MAGIVGYGAYIPKYRIKSETIAEVWGEDPDRIQKGLGILEKSVPASDEDSATMSVEAARIAMKRAGIPRESIGAVYVGSESHPYAVKPTATMVAQALGTIPNLTAADLEFACKAGTAGIQICMGLAGSNMVRYGLAIGADTAQGRPGDALEYSAAAAAAAYIIGPEEESLALIEDTFSYTTDTPDFWRRPKADFPSHGGRFTGEPAYFKHVQGAFNGLMEKMDEKIDNYDYFIFHQPNAKFPRAVAKKLGVPKEKLAEGMLCPIIGNTYSANAPLALANVLDHAKAGERIFVTSFGSGAGSDAFSIKVTDKIEEKRRNGYPLSHFIENKEYITYAIYAKLRKKYKGM